MIGLVRVLVLFSSLYYQRGVENTSIAMEKQEVQFPAGGSSSEEDGRPLLSGTLSLPSNQADTKVPGSIIIHGSGPIDRDGNAMMNLLGFLGNIHLNTHSRLTEELGDQMAVLCYDKRGIGKSVHAGNPNWYYEAGMRDLVADAVEAYRYLAKQEGVDETKIVLMGHSEGAILLPLIAETILLDKSLPPPKGLVFLAGFGDCLDEAARRQQGTALEEVAEATGFQGWILRKVITQEKIDKQYKDFMEQVKNEDQAFQAQYCGIVKVPTKWYREHMQWDAKQSLRECKSSCLAITGEKDVQVKSEYCEPSTAKELAPNASALETHIVPNMTHILRSTEEKPSLINVQKDYAKLGKEPLDADLVKIIREWLDKLFNCK